MTQITWILIAVLLSIVPYAYSEDTERVIKRANSLFWTTAGNHAGSRKRYAATDCAGFGQIRWVTRKTPRS